MDDSLLGAHVGFAAPDLDEELQAVPRLFNECSSAVIGDLDATPSSITKYGRPDSVAPPSITFAMWMIHQSECLPFRLEPGDDTFSVHARL